MLELGHVSITYIYYVYMLLSNLGEIVDKGQSKYKIRTVG